MLPQSQGLSGSRAEGAENSVSLHSTTSPEQEQPAQCLLYCGFHTVAVLGFMSPL